MPGFEYRYRAGGGQPTVAILHTRSVLQAGDMLNGHDSWVTLAVTGDTRLVGVAIAAADAATGDIAAITDADAVYGVSDAHTRRLGDTVALAGATGGQGIGAGAGPDLRIVADSADGEETLVCIGQGRHHAMDGSRDQPRLTGGELNAAITRAVVRLHREYTGRGPTRAQTFYRGNVLVVVMYDAMTRAETSLATGGRADMVITVRKAFQETMRSALTEIVESLTGCRVHAFMSANHIDPDMAAEVFVLDRPVPGEAPERR